jgi:hypothetical protein
MELQDVAVLDDVIATNVLCIEVGRPPQSSECEICGDLSMYKSCDVKDRGTVSHRVRTVHVRVPARDLRVHPHDTQPVE